MDSMASIQDTMYIGIDPGVGGAIACITADELFCIPCPSTLGDMNDSVLQLAKIHEHTGHKVYAVIEAVHSMPGNGIASSWKFAKNYGQWLGILAGNKIPYTQVTPQKWMKWLGSMPRDRKDRKNHLKHLAQQRYPHIKVTLKTADAILIAEYCRYNVIVNKYSMT